MSELLTLDDLQAAPLAEATVYLARWGKSVRLRELTGPDVLMSGQLGTRKLANSEGGVIVPDQEKRNAIRVALALVSPSLGETRELKAANHSILVGQGYIVTLLLGTVLTELTEGGLSDEQRAYLAEEHSEVEMLACLGIGDGPEAALAVAPEGELEDVLSVGLRLPAALSGGMSMGTIRLLAAQVRREQEALALSVAQALAGPGE